MSSDIGSSPSFWRRAGWALLISTVVFVLLHCTDDRAAKSRRGAWTSADLQHPAKIVTDGEPTAVSWATWDDVIWCACLVTEGSQDRLLLKGESEERSWDVVIAAGGRMLWPTIAAVGSAAVVVVWAEHDDAKGWQLRQRRFSDGALTETQSLTEGSESNGWPRLAFDRERDRLWLSWQSSHEGEWGIELARVLEPGLKERQRLSSPGSHAFAPALAVLSDGRPVVAWDAYLPVASGGRDFEVRLWTRDPKGKESIVAVSDRPGYDARPSLAADAQGGVWIAWHADRGDWGRDRALNQQRQLRLVYYRDGRIGEPAGDPGRVLPEPLNRLASNPQLATDAGGGLHLLFTGLTIPQQVQAERFPGLGKNGKAAVWELFTLRYSSEGWSAVQPVSASDGGARPRGELTADRNGNVVIGWLADGRRKAMESGVDFDRRRPESARSMLRVARGGGGPGLAAPPAFSLEASRVVDKRAESSRISRPTIEAGGQRYQLVFADLHRHTDISRCASRTDGTLMEAYRYALGPGELDVLCTTDHVTDTRETAWWEIQKLADYFDRPGRFVGLYGYERAEGSVGGHKNIFFRQRQGPQILPATAQTPRELWNQLEDRDAFGIPHMMAARGHATDWSSFDGRFEPVVEIYQGVRGAYESIDGPRRASDAAVTGSFAQDALADGLRFGFVASSDHDSVSESYAGLWVKELTRDGVFEAIRARRCFAASSPIVLDFRVDGVLAGGEVAWSEAPEISVSVRGTGPIDRIEILADGQVVHTERPSSERSELRWRDEGSEVRRYYYARVIQSDGHVGWASPVFRRD